MVSKYKARAPTDSVSLDSMFYARAVIAAGKRRMNVGKWVEEAVHEKELRERMSEAEIDFRTAQMSASDYRMPSPNRDEFMKQRGLGL